MRTAIRKGRDERKEELNYVGIAIDFAIGELDLPKEKRQLSYGEEKEQAGFRGMLKKVESVDSFGKPRMTTSSELKTSEPYDKRPSVRALKKSRGNSP